MASKELALKLHEQWNGKLETTAKASVKSREDLALAYTPGVAEPCKVIAEDPEAAYKYTMKANTVAVISDGSAVLGLGNIGPLAAMPVMEGKCVLGIWQCQCRTDLSGYTGYGRVDQNHHLPCAKLWRYQSGGYQCSQMF